MRNRSWKHLAFMAMVAPVLAGCDAIDSAIGGSTTEKPIIADQPLTTGVPETKLLSGTGGTRIAVLVDDQAITNTDIRRRAQFVKLRRLKGNPTAVARQELIDEAIKMREARRLNAVASDTAVDQAYARFAKRNKMPLNVLDKIMADRGVTKRGFKQFIRAQMSWQRAVGARMRSEGTTTAAPSAQPWLPAVGSTTRDTKEYTLQQVVFTVPKAERSQTLAAKTAAANRFRNQVTGCDNTRDLAKGLNDVAVLDRGRIRADQLPPDWRKEVETTQPGRATKVRQTPKGAEMLIVCRARDIKTVDGGADIFASEDFEEKASEFEKKYFAELKKKAVIKQR
ncbi:MAG: peptidylprolyl isomerase [Ahrensia sp.]|nr:peptidylprolyl isomerase [Ahrensia sp.]